MRPLVFAILFALAGLWLSHLQGFQIVGQMAHDGPSNPLNKTVTLVPGGWFANAALYPALWLTVAIAYLGALGAVLLRARPGSRVHCVGFGAASARSPRRARRCFPS